LTDAGLFATCEVDYHHQLSKDKELQLYRIIQEALNNTLKYAKANAAKVLLQTQHDTLILEIKDNGIGFDFNDKINNINSFGLQSILQRSRAIGGQAQFKSNTHGTSLFLTIPLQ
jgi:signal transduction histidine kinase